MDQAAKLAVIRAAYAKQVLASVGVSERSVETAFATVEREPRLAEPRHRPHDAVRFEDADLSIAPERSGHIAKRLRFQEGIGLDELRASQPDAPGSR